jgi:hypothetical protein
MVDGRRAFALESPSAQIAIDGTARQALYIVVVAAATFLGNGDRNKVVLMSVVMFIFMFMFARHICVPHNHSL